MHAVGYVWTAALVFSIYRRNTWKCPRCGKHYFYKWSYRNDFADKCVNCGLPKWTQFDAPSPTDEGAG